MEIINECEKLSTRSLDKLSILYYKYYIKNVLKDKHLFLTGQVPEKLLKEIEYLKLLIIKLEPNYFNQNATSIDIQSNCMSNNEKNRNFETIECVKAIKLSDNITPKSTTLAVSTPITATTNMSTPVTAVKSTSKVRLALPSSTSTKSNTISKTFTIDSLKRSFYEDLFKLRKILNESTPLTPKGRFISPRESSKKIKHLNHSQIKANNLNCSTCNRNLISFFDQILDSNMINTPSTINININNNNNNSNSITSTPSDLFKKQKLKASTPNSSFASKLLNFSCLSSSKYNEKNHHQSSTKSKLEEKLFKSAKTDSFNNSNNCVKKFKKIFS